MKYCCKMMKLCDERGVIDDCEPGFMTTMDRGGYAYPLNYCPFCGKPLVGTSKSIKRIEAAAKEKRVKVK